jgi:hypothetical protein
MYYMFEFVIDNSASPPCFLCSYQALINTLHPVSQATMPQYQQHNCNPDPHAGKRLGCKLVPMDGE